MNLLRVKRALQSGIAWRQAIELPARFSCTSSTPLPKGGSKVLTHTETRLFVRYMTQPQGITLPIVHMCTCTQ